MTTAATPDAELLSAHVDGDRHAFNELLRRHQDRMWAVALRTTRDPEEAADALQEACLSAFRGAARFRGQSQVGTWLHRIVVNACLDRIRRRRARPTVALPDNDAAEPSTGRDDMADRETTLAVQDALAELPDDQRAPIVLVDLEGYSVGEAAQLLGLAQGTVKSRCARGRSKLAKLLGHLRNLDAIANVPGPTSPSDAARASRHGEGSR